MKKIFSFFLPAVLALGMASCNPDEGGKDVNPEVTPEQAGVKVEATVYTLTFSWNAVDKADAYTYEFSNGEKSKTGDHTLTFTNLEPNTEYTLKVEAIDAAKNLLRKFTATGKTLGQNALAAPAGLAFGMKDGLPKVQWNAVENAASYKYVLITKDGIEKIAEEEAEATDFYVGPLANGEYKVTVVAVPSDENYSDSPVAEYEFAVSGAKLGECEGMYDRNKYSSSTKEYETVNSKRRTVEVYDNGSFVVKAFYGFEGKDLTFADDGNGSLAFPSVEIDGYGYANFETGSANYSAVEIYAVNTDYHWIVLENENYGTYMGFYHFSSDGSSFYDSLSWGGDYSDWEEDGEDDPEVIEEQTVDENAVWVAECKVVWEYYGNYSYDGTLSYGQDGSYTLICPSVVKDPLSFTVNEDGTLHFDAEDLDGYPGFVVFGYDYYYQDSYSSIEGNETAGAIIFYGSSYGKITVTWGGYVVEDEEEDGIWGYTYEMEEAEGLTAYMVDDALAVEVNREEKYVWISDFNGAEGYDLCIEYEYDEDENEYTITEISVYHDKKYHTLNTEEAVDCGHNTWLLDEELAEYSQLNLSEDYEWNGVMFFALVEDKESGSTDLCYYYIAWDNAVEEE